MGIGQSGQSVDFIVGQHVARRIGRAGDNHCRDVATGQRCRHRGKIDAIFEFPGGFALRPFNRRTAGDKTFRLKSLVGITNVFRAQWKQDFAMLHPARDHGAAG